MVQFSWPSEKAPAEIQCATDRLTPYRHAKLRVSQFDHHGLLHACAGLGYKIRVVGDKLEARGSPQIPRSKDLQDGLLLVQLTLWENRIASPCLYDGWRTCFQWWISHICGPRGGGVESQRLGCGGASGVSYRGTKSGTADLQPILGTLRSLISEDKTFCCRNAPHPICKGGKERMK